MRAALTSRSGRTCKTLPKSAAATAARPTTEAHPRAAHMTGTPPSPCQPTRAQRNEPVIIHESATSGDLVGHFAIRSPAHALVQLDEGAVGSERTLNSRTRRAAAPAGDGDGRHREGDGIRVDGNDSQKARWVKAGTSQTANDLRVAARGRVAARATANVMRAAAVVRG